MIPTIEIDCPAEKCATRGASALTNAEVLSTIIGGNNLKALEIAKTILAKYNNRFSLLSRASLSELITIPSVSRITAARIICSFEIPVRRSFENGFHQVIRSSLQLSDLFSDIKNSPVEIFKVAYLNKSNRILAIETLSIGGIDGTFVDQRILLKKALEVNACYIAISHNHPSGSLKPSSADETLTSKLKEACNIFNIKLMDHIIIAEEGFFSFADEGIL